MRNSLILCLEAMMLVVIAVFLVAFSNVEASKVDVPKCRPGIEPTKRVAPIYPADIREATSVEETRFEGWVVVEFTILETGRTDDSVVVESNSTIFHRSAKQAISEYRYSPQERACIHRERVTYRIK